MSIFVSRKAQSPNQIVVESDITHLQVNYELGFPTTPVVVEIIVLPGVTIFDPSPGYTTGPTQVPIGDFNQYIGQTNLPARSVVTIINYGYIYGRGGRGGAGGVGNHTTQNGSNSQWGGGGGGGAPYGYAGGCFSQHPDYGTPDGDGNDGTETAGGTGGFTVPGPSNTFGFRAANPGRGGQSSIYFNSAITLNIINSGGRIWAGGGGGGGGGNTSSGNVDAGDGGAPGESGTSGVLDYTSSPAVGGSPGSAAFVYKAGSPYGEINVFGDTSSDYIKGSITLYDP